MTSKRTVRQAFSDIKDEEEVQEEESDDGGEEKTYGDLASSYLEPLFHHVDTPLKIITVSDDTVVIL